MGVLVVDDDPQFLSYVRSTLAQSGYTPIVTGKPEDAVRLMEERPQLALLDMMIPGTDGIELMEEILKIANVPVIFLSAYGREELASRAMYRGLWTTSSSPSPRRNWSRGSGRPCAVGRSLRRREIPAPSEPYVRGDLTIDYPARRVTIAGRGVPLVAMEYRMPVELSVNAGRTLTYEHLLERVWGVTSGKDGDVRPMRTIVSKLRGKLGDDADNPTYVFTEPRVGYRMPAGRTVKA